MVLANCIIGDSLSANILTGAENGILSVFSLGFNDPGEKSDNLVKLTVFPNPVVDQAVVSFTIADLSEVFLTLINQVGIIQMTNEMGNLEKGRHSMKIPNEMMIMIEPGKIYCLKLSVKSTNGKFKNEAVKMIRIEK